ncbi:MAG: hypothetical protein L3J39_17920 [Verrucomicrobiales bacterium]|nr:hypothetical protein [Verrucomicrobiales bacterium]
MKPMRGRLFSILLLFICNSNLLMGEDGEIREFTDTQGRVIKAEVLLVKHGKVHLKRNGKTFRFPFADLSKEDQEYLRKWVKENVRYWFAFKESKVEQIDKRTSKGGSKEKLATSMKHYELEIANKSGVKVEDVRVEYQLAIRREWRGGKSKQEITFMVKGEDAVDSLENTKRTVLKLKNVTLLKAKWQVKSIVRVRKSDGRLLNEAVYTDYDTRYILDGIWVKLYIGDRKIAEYKSGEKSIKNAEWGKRVGYDPIADLRHVKGFSKRSR